MMPPTLKVLWHWQSMGPYHFARMRALAELPGIELTIVESAGLDDHGWIRAQEQQGLDLITLSTAVHSRRVLKETQTSLARVLDARRPDIVVAAGYAEPHSLRVILAYGKSHPESVTLLWSESTVADRSRRWIKEALKTLFVSTFDGALVAGGPHASYLRQLGMSAVDIQVVGNCVDNDFFSASGDAIGGVDSALPENFFLFVGRMIREKNISGLIEAYGVYRAAAGSAAWDLVLAGSGPQEASLKDQVKRSGIQGIWFAGLRRADELALFYARAKCFILPSVSEPWGLVVNEAMASGLPVLVSNRCGCVVDLVHEGENGFVFDPLDKTSLANLLLNVSSGAVPLAELGANGRKIVANYTPALFAQKAAGHFRSLYQRKTQRPQRWSARRLAASGVNVMTLLWDRAS